jgi:hypothetical protein
MLQAYPIMLEEVITPEEFLRPLMTAFPTVAEIQVYLNALGIEGLSSRLAYWLKGRPSFAAIFVEAVFKQRPLLDEEVIEVMDICR